MKRSLKAALLSALVFPGAGHFLLKRPARACLFLLPAAAGVIYMAREVMQRVQPILEQIESGALPYDPQLIAARMSEVSARQGPGLSIATVVVLLCWAGSIVDSLLVKE